MRRAGNFCARPDVTLSLAPESSMSASVDRARRRKVVIVTGASAGVGRATAVVFASRGWAVGLIARGRDGLAGAERDVEGAGGEPLVLPADVADAEAVFAAADQAVSHWGPIDVWVNNAMATIFAPVETITPAEFRRVTDVTYLGQVHGTLAALRHMRKRDQGTIVQVGSALAYRSIPLQSAYCAAKAAVRGFTDSLRSELIHEGSAIRLTMVQLPAVNTPQFDWARSRMPRRLQPVPPIYRPEVVAEAIYRATLEAPRELWVGLPTMQAILGTAIAPKPLDRVAAERAWGGQMTAERARASRPDNLFEPVAGDHGAHGRFGRRSRSAVTAASARTVRGAAVAVGIGLVVAAGIAGAAFASGRPPRKRIAHRRGRSAELRDD
jgi:NAD(P)-dependent dehydrogenase (short-subunit alcohol dehydrogenase family)